MANVAWEITRSVETPASPAFAWKYWTTVSNWSDPPAEFELQGPFEAGSRGLTRFPDRRLSNGFYGTFVRQVPLRLPCHSHKPCFPLNGGSMHYRTGEHASRNESHSKVKTRRLTGRKWHLRSQTTYPMQ